MAEVSIEDFHAGASSNYEHMESHTASLAVGENVRQSFTNSEINVVSGNQNITNINTYIIEAPNESQKNRIGNSKSITVFGERIGGDTKVYKGRCGMRKIDLAIKIMDKCSKSEREAKLLLTLDHENIVKVVEVGDYSGIVPQIFIAMELYHENLSDYIGNDKHLPISFQKSFDFSKQLVTAVVYLHDKQIVHRDLKPWNILISNCGEKLKVTDMGLSRTVDMGKTATTVTHILAGSSGFKAPETYETNATYHYSSDIFPLGINIYFIFTSGKHPFGDDPHHWVSNIIKNKRADLTQIPKLEPKRSQLEVLLKSMLKKNGQKRPTAKKVLDSILFMANSKVPSEEDDHRHEDERAVLQNRSDQAELAPDVDSSNTGEDLKTCGRPKMKAGTLIEHIINFNSLANAGGPDQAPLPGQEHEPRHEMRLESVRSPTVRPPVPQQAAAELSTGTSRAPLEDIIREALLTTEESSEGPSDHKGASSRYPYSMNNMSPSDSAPAFLRRHHIAASMHEPPSSGSGQAQRSPSSFWQRSTDNEQKDMVDRYFAMHGVSSNLPPGHQNQTVKPKSKVHPNHDTQPSATHHQPMPGHGNMYQHVIPRRALNMRPRLLLPRLLLHGGNFRLHSVGQQPSPIQARVHPSETYQGHVPGGPGHSADVPGQVMDLFQPSSHRPISDPSTQEVPGSAALSATSKRASSTEPSTEPSTKKSCPEQNLHPNNDEGTTTRK